MTVDEKLHKKITILTRICAQNKVGFSIGKNRLKDFNVTEIKMVSDGFIVQWTLSWSSGQFFNETSRIYWADLEELD